jgi:subtilase family serine protease
MNTTETNVFCVGAIDGNSPYYSIAEYSGRGPTVCSGAGNKFKPEVVAPGDSVRSSFLFGSYQYASGTSLAAPHVSGAIALLKQAFPEKTGSELKMMLYQTARDLGEPGEDNSYGNGLIDVYAAYLLTSVAEELQPIQSALPQNYPNPFNPSTTIQCVLPEAGFVTLKIYNALGEEICTLISEERDAGIVKATWDATGLPSGVYFYRLSTGGHVQVGKALLVR